MQFPRFTLSELLLAVTLIAVGVGGLCSMGRQQLLGYSLWGDPTDLREHLLFFGSAAAIGAGIGVLFHRRLWGAILGLLAPFACSVVWLFFNRP